MSRSSSGSPTGHLLPQTYLTNEEEKLFGSWVRCTLNQRDLSDDVVELVASIPTSSQPSYLPLLCFSRLLNNNTGPKSALEAIRLFIRLWATTLPEAAKSLANDHARTFVRQLQQHLAAFVGDIPSLFTASNSPAIIDPNSRRTLSHGRLSTFIKSFSLPLSVAKTETRPVIVVALPNGYLLGVACLAVASHYTAAPISITGGAKQFQSDAELTQPQAILVLEHDIERLGLRLPWVSNANIQILVIKEDNDGTFGVRSSDQVAALDLQNRTSPNLLEDIALILLTSGTSGTKKVVPVTSMSLLAGVACVISSWGLSNEDSCINMMPLNHV